ncbi:unnamed protein product [Oppiella nova]|uniref:Nucleolus and neural progenitor protein-like N-terminal domain-containing protein n=1 Tax=Oppiella nova TaxID=334625 RepID=A0A7R9M449_9ACAR|nr:unnamed protein product [Oppiella nova]CAG2169206.1 unnamed protein product [Oppiella nova]
MSNKYDWSEYQTIQCKYDLKAIKKWFNSLTALLNGVCLTDEYIVFTGVMKRITIRLRNAKVSRIIKHANKCLKSFFALKLSDVMNDKMSSLVVENYDISSGHIVLPFRQQIESVLQVFVESLQILRKFILISQNAFSHCTPWLRTGHLVPHFLMMSSSLSRLNVISKAIIVYISDLYSALFELKDGLREQILNYKAKPILVNSLDDYLTELNIKCAKHKIETNRSQQTEDVGVAIERSEPIESAERVPVVTKKKKKPKTKNKLKLEPKKSTNKTTKHQNKRPKQRQKFKRKN